MYETSTKEKRRTQKYKRVLNYVNGAPDRVTEYTRQGPTQVSTVTSWRGKRPEKDKYGWYPPHEFELNKFSVKYTNEGATYSYSIGDTLYYHATFKGLISPFYFGDMAQLAPVPPALSSLRARAREQAQLEAWASLQEADIPLASYLAEAKETAKSLIDVGKNALFLTIGHKETLQKAKAAMKKKDKLSQIADAWLRYRYEVTPLMLQISEMLEFLDRGERERLVVTGRVSRKLDDTVVIGTKSFAGSVNTFEKRINDEVIASTKLYPSAVRTETDYGLQAHDAIAALWEIATLSFVVDWFVDIGGYLAAWRPGNAEVEHQVNTTVVRQRINIVCSDSVPITSYKNVSGSFGGHEVRHDWVKRDIEAGKPYLPIFTAGALSTVRQIDSAALFYKMFGEKVFRN